MNSIIFLLIFVPALCCGVCNQKHFCDVLDLHKCYEENPDCIPSYTKWDNYKNESFKAIVNPEKKLEIVFLPVTHTEDDQFIGVFFIYVECFDEVFVL